MSVTELNRPEGSARAAASGAWAWAALLPALGLSIATFTVAAPPFPDVPFHVASAAIRADFRSVPAFSQYYSLYDSVGPNTLFHSIAAASGHPLWAMRALIAFATVGMAAMSLLLARRCRTGPIFPLVAGLFAVNFSLVWGFVEFVVGVPFMLLLVWLLGWTPPAVGARRRRAAIVGWATALAALLLLIFYAHAILSIFTLCVLGAYVLLTFRGERDVSIAAALAAFPTLVGIALWKLSRTGDPGGPRWLLGYYRHNYLTPDALVLRAFDLFNADLGKLVSPLAGAAIASGVVLVSLVAIAACFLASRRVVRDAVLDAAPQGAPMRAARAFTLAGLVVVLFAPPGYPPFWSVYQRFVFALIVGLALWSGAAATRRFAPRPLVYLLVLLNLAVGGLWFEHVRGYAGTSGDLAALAASTRVQGLGAYVVGDTGYRNEPEALVHTGNLMTVFGDAPVQSELYDYPYARIRRGPSLTAAVPMASSHYKGYPELLRNLETFDWILVHANVPPGGRDDFIARTTLLGQRGVWSLYARRREDVATTGPVIVGPSTRTSDPMPSR